MPSSSNAFSYDQFWCCFIFYPLRGVGCQLVGQLEGLDSFATNSRVILTPVVPRLIRNMVKNLMFKISFWTLFFVGTYSSGSCLYEIEVCSQNRTWIKPRITFCQDVLKTVNLWQLSKISQSINHLLRLYICEFWQVNKQ